MCQPWRQDLEFGLLLLWRLRDEGLGPGVRLEDWSYGTVPAFQRLQALPHLRRAVFLSASERGRPPGTLHRRTPPLGLPGPAEVQARIADGAMGLVCVDNLMVMARHYGALPPDVVVVEVEPVDDGWGRGLSPVVAGRLEEAMERVRREVARPFSMEAP
ncbi:MAG: hypothetical protein KY453_06230 [Gemmatimonadetes bacterium]|nr:hypothetical protein [Gemmatimonadota bacterium]